MAIYDNLGGSEQNNKLITSIEKINDNLTFIRNGKSRKLFCNGATLKSMHDIAYLDSDKPAFESTCFLLRQTSAKRHVTISLVGVDTELNFKFALGGDYNNSSKGIEATFDGNNNVGDIFYGIVEWYVN